MLNKTEQTLKNLAKIGSALTILIAASACTHQQLKSEADQSAIEEQSGEASFENPTPDLMAPATPIPGDDGLENAAPLAAPIKHHGRASGKSSVKKASKKGAYVARRAHRPVAKRTKRVKTMVAAAAGRVDDQLPPAGPTSGLEESLTAAPVAPALSDIPEVEQPVSPELAIVDQDGGHVWVSGLILIALASLGFAAFKFRKTRVTRNRLVFN